MNLLNLRRVFIGVIFSLIGFGCVSQSKLFADKVDEESEVEISYLLGHQLYQINAINLNGKREVSSGRDGVILEKAVVQQDQFVEFAKFAEKTARESSENPLIENCRSPFSIRIKVKSNELISSGCRTDQGHVAISDLIRKGESLAQSAESSDQKSE